MTLVSVFIPIYNASKYMCQCVDSILSQSYTDLEVLLCNDCSKDHSLDICRRYEAKDCRVRVINNERNLGLYNSRLKVLDEMKGKYFFQVDADDWIEKDCIKTMVEKAEEYDVDVVTIRFIRTLDKWGLISTKSNQFKPGLYTGEQLSKCHHIYTQRVFSNNVWSKLIRMEVIMANKPQSSDIHFGEDVFFMQNISSNINKIYVCPQYGFFYRYGGSTMAYNPKFWADHSKLFWFRKAYALEHEPEYVHGLTLFLLDVFKSVLRNKLFFNHPELTQNEIISDIEKFYTSKEYDELTALDDHDECIDLLRRKDSIGLIEYIKSHNSFLSIMKTKLIARSFIWISSVTDFFSSDKSCHLKGIPGSSDQKLVSVFVPVYNAEKHLRQCVDSILDQTYFNIELILFNDASKDHSLDICREYESKDKRVRVIDNQKNVGVYNGRLHAIECMRGDYFLQVDSDDWIAADYVQTAVECAEQHGADVVAMGFYRTLDSWGWVKQPSSLFKEQMYDEESLKQYHSIYTQRVFSNNVGTKLINTRVFGNRCFEPSDIHYGDDLLFLQVLSPNIRSVYSLPVCKYFYRYGGSTTSFNPKFWTDQSKLYWLRKQYALEHEPEYVPGLTQYFASFLEESIRLRLFFNDPRSRKDETVRFLEDFYSSEDYKDIVAVDDGKNEFIHLLKSRDTDGIIRYVVKTTSRLSIMKTKMLGRLSSWVSKF